MRLLRRKGSERRLSGGAPFASEGCWEKLEEAMISEEWGILGEICSLGNGGSRLAESRLAVAQERKNLDFLVAKTRVILLGTMANHEFLAKAMSAEEYTAMKVAAKLDCEDYKECVETEGSTESDWASLAEKNVALEAEEAAEALGRDGWELELKIP
ncbi:MAG: hypothetical protein MMC23_003145 [Stictis urceolatum]|nr:hypothetical protein [Stictis urceolata]